MENTSLVGKIVNLDTYFGKKDMVVKKVRSDNSLILETIKISDSDTTLVMVIDRSQLKLAVL